MSTQIKDLLLEAGKLAVSEGHPILGRQIKGVILNFRRLWPEPNLAQEVDKEIKSASPSRARTSSTGHTNVWTYAKSAAQQKKSAAVVDKVKHEKPYVPEKFEAEQQEEEIDIKDATDDEIYQHFGRVANMKKYLIEGGVDITGMKKAELIQAIRDVSGQAEGGE